MLQLHALRLSVPYLNDRATGERRPSDVEAEANSHSSGCMWADVVVDNVHQDQSKAKTTSPSEMVRGPKKASRTVTEPLQSDDEDDL